MFFRVFQISRISTKTAVMGRSNELSVGRSTTTRRRRLIWLLSVSQALEARILLRWFSGEGKDGEPFWKVALSPLR